MSDSAYSKYCGPGAYSAIVGLSREASAEALARRKARAGWAETTGTSPTVLATGLIANRFEIERWSPYVNGWRVQTAAEFSESHLSWLDREAEAFKETATRQIDCEDKRSCRKLSPIAQAAANEMRATRRARWQRRRSRVLTVREWRERFGSAGRWVLWVPGHVLVLAWGRVAAGDDDALGRYGEVALIQVWRVVPRRWSTEGGKA